MGSTLIFIRTIRASSIFKQKELNLRQRRGPELLKDHDADILYHPRKANVVADTLSRKSMGGLTGVYPEERNWLESVWTTLDILGVSVREVTESSIMGKGKTASVRGFYSGMVQKYNR